MAVAHYPAEEMMPATPDHAAYLRATAAAHRTEATAAEATANQHRTEATNLEAIATAIDTPTVPIPPVTPPTTAAKGTMVQRVGTTLDTSVLNGPDPVIRWAMNLRTWINTATIPAANLARFRSDLQLVKDANKAVVLRPVYNYDGSTSPTDASQAVMFAHIDQLAKVVNDFPGTVLTVEAGLVGHWGEWWGTTGVWGERWAPTQARKDLMVKLLTAFTGPVSFRYPTDIRIGQPLWSAAQYARVGFHDDSMLANRDDNGTWDGADGNNWEWMQANFFNTKRIVDGEFEKSSYTDSELIAAVDRLRLMQLRAAHQYYNMETINRLKALNHPSGGKCWDYLLAGLQLA